jgi:hypothetical protein
MKKEVAIKEQKDVVVKEETALMIPEMDMGFGMDNLINSDIRVPKILLVQQMSKMATDDKIQARPGELRESFEGTKLGDVKNPVKIVPFYFTNTWTVKKEKNGKMEFYDIQDRVGSDIQRDYEGLDADSVKTTNHKTLNLFALVVGQSSSIPYMISFMNSSFKFAAQPFLNKANLLAAPYRLQDKKSPAHIVWNLGSIVIENDKGKFFAFTIEAAKDEKGQDIPTSNELLSSAYHQYKLITSHLKDGGKIDMSDLSDDESITTTSKPVPKTISTEDVPF